MKIVNLFIMLLTLAGLVSTGPVSSDLNAFINVKMECGDDEAKTVRVVLTSTNAVVESYIAFGPGDDMENMDPAICIIKLDKTFECKDFGSSATNVAPDRDTTDNGQNNLVVDEDTTVFNDTLKTATFNFTRPMV